MKLGKKVCHLRQKEMSVALFSHTGSKVNEAAIFW
jgi:hypothetical protein